MYGIEGRSGFVRSTPSFSLQRILLGFLEFALPADKA
jgi:hypothetical protein